MEAASKSTVTTTGKSITELKTPSAHASPTRELVWTQHVEGVVNLKKQVDNLEKQLETQDKSYQRKIRELEDQLLTVAESKKHKEEEKVVKSNRQG